MWLPPRSPRSASTSTTAACRRGQLAVVEAAGRAGRVEARPPQDLVRQKVADPRHPGLVEQPGLQRAVLDPRAAASSSGVTDRASSPSRSSSGSSDDAAEPARVPDAAARSRRRTAARSGPSAGTSRPLEYSSRSIVAAPSTSSRPVMPKRSPSRLAVVEVEHQQLAAAPDAPSTRRPGTGDSLQLGGLAALDEPGVGRIDGGDRAPDDGLGLAAIGLHLQQLRHGPQRYGCGVTDCGQRAGGTPGRVGRRPAGGAPTVRRTSMSTATGYQVRQTGRRAAHERLGRAGRAHRPRRQGRQLRADRHPGHPDPARAGRPGRRPPGRPAPAGHRVVGHRRPDRAGRRLRLLRGVAPVRRPWSTAGTRATTPRAWPSGPSRSASAPCTSPLRSTAVLAGPVAARRSAGGNEQQETARVLDWPAGRWIVLAVGRRVPRRRPLQRLPGRRPASSASG